MRLGPTKETFVKTYSAWRALQRGIAQMAKRAYRVHHRRAEFTTNPFTCRSTRRKVTVTRAQADRGPEWAC